MLLERGAETTALRALVVQSGRGVAGIALVEGEPGIGKTSLLRATEQHARDEHMRVLTARCASLEQDFAFGAARQLLEPVLASAGPSERATLLAGSAAPAEPVFGCAMLDGQAPRTADGASAVLDGLYRLTANLAGRRPLLLAIDDLHWIDTPSLRWLTSLARRLDGLPVALALTVRAGEPPVDAGLISDLMNSPRCHLLRPRRLSAGAVAQVVRRRLGPHAAQEFCAACASATRGNPFLLRELLVALEAEGVAPTAGAAARVSDVGPQAVSRHVLARLSGRSPAAVQLARAAAVLGEPAELRLTAAMCGLDEEAAAEAAAELTRIGVLSTRQPMTFAHPVVREAIYREPPSGERCEWHECAARLLRAERAPVERIAAHLLAIDPGRDASTVRVLRDAAQRALAGGAPDTAAACLRRALREPLTPQEYAEVAVETGAAELHIDPRAAADHLSEGLRASRDPCRRAQVSLLLGHALTLTRRSPEAVRVVRRALDDVRDLDADLALRLEGELQYLVMVDQRTVPPASEWLAGVDQHHLRSESPVGRLLLAMRALEAFGSGSRSDAVDLARRALVTGGRSDAGEHWSAVLVFLMTTLGHAGEEALAGRLLDDAVREARRRGSLVVAALALGLRSNLHLLAGSVEDALKKARAALDLVDLPQLRDCVALPVVHLLEPLLEHGRLDEGQSLLERAGFAGQMPTIWPCNLLLDARGRLRLARGDARGALEDFREAGRRQLSWRVYNPAILAWRSNAARALARLGEHEEARLLAHTELELARQWGAPRPIGVALRAVGMVEGGEEGIAHLRAAVAALERSPARLERARALADLGTLLRRAGRRRAARDSLRTAVDLAARCGSTALEARAREELVAAGERVRRRAGTGTDILTAAETRVAMMAATGKTNRDIATELVVGQRTVESHLTQAYRKLGIPGRSRLRAALRAVGMVS